MTDNRGGTPHNTALELARIPQDDFTYDKDWSGRHASRKRAQHVGTARKVMETAVCPLRNSSNMAKASFKIIIAQSTSSLADAFGGDKYVGGEVEMDLSELAFYFEDQVNEPLSPQRIELSNDKALSLTNQRAGMSPLADVASPDNVENTSRVWTGHD